jgi:vacuolar-type H+-ATPase subunit F/Vma7
MNIYVVGDVPLVEAFEVIGIPGRMPRPGQGVNELVAELARGEGAELVLVQTALAARLSNDQFDQLARRWGCLVLEIPGVGEAVPDPAEFLRTVQSAMGAVT